MATPQHLDEVDADWLAGAMHAPIDRIDVTPIAVGEGFMGRLARVTIESGDPTVPDSVIVKLPTDEPGGRAIGEMMRVWEREHRFYAEVAPEMSIRVPTAHVNVADPPCLVLEDLVPAVPGDHVAGATLDQAERAIDVLARHHATWFEHPMLASLDWMPDLHDPSVAVMPDLFAAGWPAFRDRFDGELSRRSMRWCEELIAIYPDYVASHANDPVTLAHGDFRLDNLFFGDDGSVAVIDWQLSMRMPGQADFVYFCANNLTVDSRRDHEADLLQRYVDGLHAGGVDRERVTLDSVRQGYLEGLVFFATSMGASLLSIDPSNERGIALFEALVQRTFTAADELEAGRAFGFDIGP